MKTKVKKTKAEVASADALEGAIKAKVHAAIKAHIVPRGSSMDADELKAANADIEASRSARLVRALLLTCFIANGRKVEDMSAPSKEDDNSFWLDLCHLSFQAIGAKTSTKGHPDGEEYSILPILELAPSDQPDWVMIKQFGAAGDRTLRQHWQAQTGAWIRDVKRSWERRIAVETALGASPSANNRAFNVIKLEQLTKVLESIQKKADYSFDGVKVCKLLREVIALIDSSTESAE